MKTKVIILLMFLSISCIVLFQSCKKEDKSENVLSGKSNDSLVIAFGTFFGMSYGYSKQEIELHKNYAKISWSGWDTIKFPVKQCEQTITEEDWNKIVAEVEKINFSKLDTIYGCPDCCDGGAGWIIVERPGKRNKVMLDLQLDEPKELQNLWSMLGNLKGELKKCE